MRCVQSLTASGPAGNKEASLMPAAEKGHVDCMKVLLSTGANVNYAVPGREQTALILAAKNGHELCVDTLLQVEADVNIRNRNQNTALAEAAMREHVGCINLLMKCIFWRKTAVYKHRN